MHIFPKWTKNLKVTLCHDWLTGMRGGEKVLETLCQWFPSADIYTLIYNPNQISDIINSHNVKTSWLNRLPNISKYYRYALPLFPSAIERMPFPQSDVLISTSHCVAKSLPHSPQTKHLCYCFTPMRYAWTFFDEYFGRNLFFRTGARPLLRWLQNWDRKTANGVDRFVGISQHIQNRIQNFYGRTSDVVYPAADTERITPSPTPHNAGFDLIVSALVPYKRIDLAVKTYNEIGFPLKIVGTGTETKKLAALANNNITFLGWRSDEEILDLYRNCRMLVFPGEEDFGIVPVEAQACGKPVVAFAKGGATESVIAGETGVLFQESSVESLSDAVTKCAATKWDHGVIRKNAERFGISNFINGLAKSLEQMLDL